MFHLIHISKTGGSALQQTLRPLGRRDIRIHGHGFRLPDVEAGDQAFFVVRDPVKRFVSGFNSRLRKGLPLRFHDWKDRERRTFERFRTPNELAEALTSDDADLREAGEAGMDSMIHTRRAQGSWLGGGVARFETMIDRVAFVGEQASLSADFAALRRVLGLDESVVLPEGEGAHRTPDGFDTALSDAGRQAIADWYAEDYALYRRCLALREELLAKIGA